MLPFISSQHASIVIQEFGLKDIRLVKINGRSTVHDNYKV